MPDADRLPRYRLLTGFDDASFCRKVSQALDLGYNLYGSPAITTKDGQGYVAQAVLWQREEPTPFSSSRPA
ncbi:Uncharacterized conserved small protein [Dermatophilus congolensis]|uniref:Uncharacterized conserved small protein n=1 Tax=Dermatophilus congolensis TaxID=1863 RepID=A0AA46GZP4_9MICO|nr:DUF1737 domain-containing protein [Dermatophilus congolensis]STD05020.1 Uncharacterized conserved small protein [Dermatophilus congolensis]